MHGTYVEGLGRHVLSYIMSQQDASWSVVALGVEIRFAQFGRPSSACLVCVMAFHLRV